MMTERTDEVTTAEHSARSRGREARGHTAGQWGTAAAARGLGFLVALLAGCGAATSSDAPPSPDAEPEAGQAATGMVQPGAPGEASRRIDPGAEGPRARHPHTEADVLFMQNMIHHHAQALVMSRLVRDRTENEQIRLLAQRIHRSQMDEIQLMQRWLEARDEEAPEPIAMDDTRGPEELVHHAGRHAADPETALMAGMLTPEQLETLAGSRGREFDRRFLEAMIFHHAGALEMVAELFASPGAAQDSAMYQFASHVDADQRMEIGRMQRLLQEFSDDP